MANMLVEEGSRSLKPAEILQRLQILMQESKHNLLSASNAPSQKQALAEYSAICDNLSIYHHHHHHISE
jgi:hypothetical protein